MELAMVVDPLLNLAVAATTATTTTIASMDLLPPLVELGVVAVISAAVGVMSQVPRIHALEQELSVAKRALAASQVDTQDKLNVLEEKLFVMDQEFEEQTVRFQRQYDRTQREQMEAFKDKLRRDTAFQVEIQMAQSKSAQLMSQASEENSRTFKQEELSQLKLKQQQLNDANAQLEQALQTADQELDALRTAAASKKKFLLW